MILFFFLRDFKDQGWGKIGMKEEGKKKDLPAVAMA